MEKDILKHLGKHFIQKDELRKKLRLKDKESNEKFEYMINELVENGKLYFEEGKGYKLFTNDLGVAFGEIELNKAGNGFVHTNDGYTIFIEHSDLNGSLHGDKVIVKSIISKSKGFKGEIDHIVKRSNGNVVFEVVGNGLEASLVPYNFNDDVPISIKKHQYKDLLDGQLVRINVGITKDEEGYIANIEDVVGYKSDPNIDLKLIYVKKNVPIDFSDEALYEATLLPREVTSDELVGRVDLRDKDIIAIDCDDTKDRDDAVYIEKFNNGSYKLYVNISHVSHYVKPGSALYKEASTRCTSHYPNNTCNPMFPRTLSNGICSLNENVDRLTRTVEMDFSPEGELLDYDIYLSVINTKKNMKYSEVNRVLNGEEVEGYEPYKRQLILMNELSNILESLKQERNYLDFDIPEVKVCQDKDGTIEKLIERQQGDAEKIIENFMLVTGTTVANNFSWLPFIYRVHESPDPEAVTNVIKTLTVSGFNLPKYKNIDEYSIKEILEHVKTKEEALIIKTMLLKSMKRARYDTRAIGHFALQLKNYSHFTSPIRRFADFRIHTLIDNVETLDYNHDNMVELEKELIEVATNTSTMEKTAQEIENEALLMAMAEYMEGHIGEAYTGIVTEVYSHGMFVKADNLVSGKVSFNDMGSGKFKFDYDKKTVVNCDTHQKYQIGNKVYVAVKDASKIQRTVNFEIIDKPKQKVLKKK